MPYDEVMHKWKAGTLKSGSGDPVRSRQQAIAIMLSEKRKAGSNPEYRSVNAAGGLDSVPLPKGIARGTQPMAAPRNPGYDLFKRKLMLVRARKRPGTAQQPGLPPDLPQSPF